jgi:two-component system, chemotaxis family, CheB/CheR fusion protein
MTQTGIAAEEGAREAEFEALLEFIRDNRGFDFTGYKRPSLKRRIDLRMVALGIPSYAEYTDHLSKKGPEFVELFNTILINVTSFFRDPAAWRYLTDVIVPRILEARPGDTEIRIWSAGCATGEEAYSLAIVLADALGVEEFKDRVKIYATDVDEDALANARHGRYAEGALEDVSQEQRERYFEPSNSGYVFNADLRRCVIFGRNDLIVDPPISRIDLVAARNTLMYFGAETQRKILANFHFALNADGFLFLGRSEMLVTRSTLFEPVDLKRRVFAKIAQPDFRENLRQMTRPPVVVPKTDTAATRAREAIFDSAPLAQLVVDADGLLTLANIQARTFLGLGVADIGRPLHDLEISYRPVDLRTMIDEASTTHHTVAARDIEWRVGGETRWFDIHVAALHAVDGAGVGMGITFTETSRYRAMRENLELSKERLETAYEELQSTAEELETTNEELQSTNEEMETTNEELQSTNEELETMNEELQSTNEELHTINDTLRERTEELDEVNAFLESILSSLDAAVIVTDSQFAVQAWNSQARALWGLSADEVRGHHFTNLDIGLPVDRVMPLLRSASTPAGGSAQETFDAINRRGQRIACLATATPLTGSDGEVRGVILLMRELEPRPEAE